MSVATLRHQMSCPSDFMRVGAVIPLEVSTSKSLFLEVMSIKRKDLGHQGSRDLLEHSFFFCA